jgi:hypothetical protein
MGIHWDPGVFHGECFCVYELVCKGKGKKDRGLVTF